MKHIFFSMLAIILFFSFQAKAEESFDYSKFQSIPVQNEGRIKPLSTFSRNFLYAINGHESLSSLSAEAWLCEILFDPAQAMERPVFRVFKPDIIGLKSKEKNYFSFRDIASALQKKSDTLTKLSQIPPKELSSDQSELLRINDLAGKYLQLLRSFSFALPLSVNLPELEMKEWRISNEKVFTLEDYKRIEDSLNAKVKRIIKNKGENPAKYNAHELAIATFSFEMKILEQSGDDNVLFRIIPNENNPEAEWLSPWNANKQSEETLNAKNYLTIWKNMASAYLMHDSSTWKNASKQAYIMSTGFDGAQKIPTEIAYNILHPLSLSLLFYLIGFLCCLSYFFTQKNIWQRIGLGFLCFAGALNLMLVTMRIIILSRPPVGTLYESIVFVCLICAGVSIALEFKKRDGIGLLSGCLCGVFLLFTAEAFSTDDTLKMLGAVLNTNFWLATHVLCITAGYAWCLIISILAHIWLFKHAIGKEGKSILQPLKILMIIALLFTAVGTILGGIWADQSWGRFWGWDPKENGALLIVLWLIWILHGQISGHLKRRHAIMAMAALSIVVSLAWFGVNLLNVGLHSYGFISGVAIGLFSFIVFELALIGVLGHLAKQKQIVKP